MKTTKHQPNIKALIHLYANGEPKELCSGNVSSTAVDSEGDTCLYTYSTRLATRRKVGKNTVFVVNAKNYSMSSSRHKRYLHNSIGCELATPHVFENDGETQDYEKAKKSFLRYMKEGYAITIPTIGYIGMGQASTVEYVRLEVLKFVERMQNKRVYKITEYEIEQAYTLMLKTQWFAKAFSIKNHKFTALFAKFKKVAGAYIERTEGRALRLELEKKEAKQNSKKFVDNLVEQHSVTWQLVIGSIATQYREDVQKWRNGEGSAGSWTWLHSWVQQRLTQPFLDLRELWSTCLRKFYWTEFPRLADLFIYLYGKLIPDGTLLKEYEDSELLRVKNGNVETSKGAVLSELLVQKCFQKWKPELSMAEVGFGREERVGVYPLQSIKDGIVTIGCHRIRTQEILELAEKQGW